MFKKILLIPLLLMPLIFLGVGCAKKTASPLDESRGAYQKGAASVEIKNYLFNPRELGVKKGTEVTWTNNDETDHQVLLDTGVGSKILKKGESWTFLFRETGKFIYHSAVHPSMVGTVFVK